MLGDDPHVSSSLHPHSSVLGDDGGSTSGLLGPIDSQSNVSSTTTDHASQFLGHLDGVSGTQSSSSHDDIFFTGNSSRSLNSNATNTIQGSNPGGSVGINNLFGNNNGSSSKGGPPSQQSFGPSSVSASSMSNPSPQQPHTPHTPTSHPIHSPSPCGAAPLPSPANSVPMASPVASLPPPSPLQMQPFSKPLKSPASVQGAANSIRSPMGIAPPSPSPTGSLSSRNQTNQLFHSSNIIKTTSITQASITSTPSFIRSMAPVTQTQQIQTAQGQVLLSQVQPTMIQGGSTMLAGAQVVQQGVPTLIQTATGGLMQIALPPQINTIGSVASPVNVPTSARLPLSLNSIVSSTPSTTFATSIPQNVITTIANAKAATTRQQPQLLPKYSSSAGGKPKASAPLQYTIAATQNSPLAQTQAIAAGASPLLFSTGGAVLQALQGVATASPQSAANPTMVLGQNLVVGNAGQTNSPFLIQQPNGNPPVIMVRSNPPTIQQSTPTILPIVSQAPGAPTGTLVLQQPQGATLSGAATAGFTTPQVKIITPQGRMQVQQIQTPTGPKLITVPVGQGITGQTTAILPQTIQTASPTIPAVGSTTLGQIQQISGGATFASLGTPTMVSSLPNSSLSAPSSTVFSTSLIQSVPTMGGMGLPTAIPMSNSSTPIVGASSLSTQPSSAPSDTIGGQLTATPKSSGTKKKGKRKSKKPDPMAAATTAVVNSALEAVGQKPPTRSGGLDLGELMKDVGLDLEGFGVDEASAQAALSAAGNLTTTPIQSTLPIVPQQVFNTSQGGTSLGNLGNLSLPSAAAAAIQGLSLPGVTLSMTGASAATMTVSGATSLPILGNTQTVAASAGLNSAQSAITSPGNQLVAQLQQPLPLQVSQATLTKNYTQQKRKFYAD